MKRPLVVALVAVATLFAGAIVVVFALTQPAGQGDLFGGARSAPASAAADRPDAPPAPASPALPPAPAVRRPEPALPTGALARPELRGRPVVPLPGDPEAAADRLVEARRQRFASAMTLLNRRAARQVGRAPAEPGAEDLPSPDRRPGVGTSSSRRSSLDAANAVP